MSERRTADRAMYAVYAVFILNGFAFASWASRIPQVRDGLELNPQQLGLVLLAIAIGSLISMPLAGHRDLAGSARRGRSARCRWSSRWGSPPPRSATASASCR